MKRRRFLVGLGTASLSGAVGCLYIEDSDNMSIRPETDPEIVPDDLQCDESGTKRISKGYHDGAVQWGDAGGFTLRVDGLSFDFGDTALIVLTNTSSERIMTGTKHHYNLERYTSDGWRDVRVWDGGSALPLSDVAVSHAPGDGFSWNIELTESGIIQIDSFDEDEISVCPSLGSGRYRFVFWILNDDNAVAVAFDLNRGT